MRVRRSAAMVLIAMTLAGCAGGASLSDTPPAAEMTMIGRWMLQAPNAPACGLNFTAKPGATEGNVAPEGGCPERFFTSRRWTLRQSALTISDDDNSALGELAFTGDRFEGKSMSGTPLTLSR